MNGAVLLVLRGVAIPVEWRCRSLHTDSDKVPDTCFQSREELMCEGVPGGDLPFPAATWAGVWLSSCVLLSQISCTWRIQASCSQIRWSLVTADLSEGSCDPSTECALLVQPQPQTAPIFFCSLCVILTAAGCCPSHRHEERQFCLRHACLFAKLDNRFVGFHSWQQTRKFICNTTNLTLISQALMNCWPLTRCVVSEAEGRLWRSPFTQHQRRGLLYF